MTITVYDWKNAPKFVDIPVENIDEIASIYVHVISGDETGLVYLKSGNDIWFDASNNRHTDWSDGAYEIDTSEGIKTWMEFKFDDDIDRAYSYQRQESYSASEVSVPDDEEWEDYEDEESDDVIDI